MERGMSHESAMWCVAYMKVLFVFYYTFIIYSDLAMFTMVKRNLKEVKQVIDH